MNRCKLQMVIDGSKTIDIKENIDYVFANQMKLFRESQEKRDNIEYKIISM